MKSKGHVKTEDLKILVCMKKNSKSENGLNMKYSETKDNLYRPKEAKFNEPMSATIKQQGKQYLPAKAKSHDVSPQRLRLPENKGASKLSAEISMMLRMLSEMHSHEANLSNKHNQEFFPAEDCDHSLDEIELIDNNLLVTMKDVSPAEDQ